MILLLKFIMICEFANSKGLCGEKIWSLPEKEIAKEIATVKPHSKQDLLMQIFWVIKSYVPH